ncbi:MAG: SCP2 sterol-binding domain-containing protein [Nitrososphaerota archaeon]|jgi:putative sterol carrier protein|nr:SCP2 sterol-binding domain-containing protein [Nitrososphaerota archaeon]MDG6930257.1 SCP2 sterol-binding domain-containing protein [Nitrososphaerota archaeon]MDG6932619.1 SCP2 sterol-binding domain-containing protein [Nitrososphaerota archaeon]MDG6935589.1 SCP2 sterol-binding domain-containing protein [Nitrososphaerota archaeon]MDG6944033.1 SCP2 sterol-binding domain-containing protein [Nitrososphaerota archaeon]
MVDILPYLEGIRKKVSEGSLHREFESFNRTVLFDFPDTGKQYALKFAGGKAELIAGKIDRSDISVSTNSDVLANILDKKTNPVTAYVSRKIKVKGEMQDLLKLQKLMG